MPGKKQATHNEKLCDKLLKDGNFTDWVVTTAFYSALHYVDYEMFPLTSGTEGYSTFDEYYKKKHPLNSPSKHKIRRELVAKHLPKCSSAFNWLQDTCFNSRYNEYELSKTFGTVAKEKLEIVKSCCKKP